MQSGSQSGSQSDSTTVGTGAGGDILAAVRDGVATVTLNRPAALNALTREMFDAIGHWLAEWGDDDAVRIIVLRGAGAKAFCAGGDVRRAREAHLAGVTIDDAYFAHEYAIDFAIHDCRKPVVAVMDGITMGGGMGLAQGATLRIVTSRSRLAMPETAIGLFPDVGATWFLPRTPGQVGMYLGLTGNSIGAGDALYAGLADVFLDDAALRQLDTVMATAARARSPREALATAVKAMSAEPHEGELRAHRAAIDRHFGLPSVEAILGSLAAEAEPSLKDWADRTHATLLKRCPTSLRVTLAQMQRGRSLSLADAFRLELGMVKAAFEHGDVIEGVRAVLVDKDHRPQWRPPTLAEVSDDLVARFFRPRWAPDAHPLRHL